MRRIVRHRMVRTRGVLSLARGEPRFSGFPLSSVEIVIKPGRSCSCSPTEPGSPTSKSLDVSALQSRYRLGCKCFIISFLSTALCRSSALALHLPRGCRARPRTNRGASAEATQRREVTPWIFGEAVSPGAGHVGSQRSGAGRATVRVLPKTGSSLNGFQSERQHSLVWPVAA
jgi:hypothetical protein